MFKARAGIFAVHIPYNGGAPAQLGLLSGQVDFNFDNLATAAPNIRSGRLTALAVTTPGRSPALPDLPAISEQMPGFSVDTWWGLVAPAATPASVITQLNQVFVQALQHDDTKSRFATLMAEPVPSTPEAFGRFMQAELAKYEGVVKESGASAD
jgi:tripartite-type tricarboxylate transporter receptor subunit TctC